MRTDEDVWRAEIRRIRREYGLTCGARLGISLKAHHSAGFFQLLVLALLTAAHISPNQRLSAAKSLFDQGWATAEKLAGVSQPALIVALLSSGDDASRARAESLQESSRLLLRLFKGDLRKLRQAAGQERTRERDRLMVFPGMTEAGADLFFREVQDVWEEWLPFADRLVLTGARRMGLPGDPETLLELAGRRHYVELAAGLAWWQENMEYNVVVG